MTLITNTGNITNLQNDKQDNLTAGTNVSIIGNVISSTDTNDIYTAGANVSISAANVISSTDTDTTYTAGTNVSIIGNEISSTDTNTEYTAGANVSIIGNVISSTDTNTNTEYTAAANGGLSLSGTEFSLDLSTLTSTQTLPEKLEIVSDTDTQLLITGESDTGKDARMVLRGRRNASTSNNHAQFRFENYDNDLNNSNILGAIYARVSNTITNVGGLLFVNFVDGITATTAMSMSNNGNFFVGGGTVYQDEYKFKITGDTKLDGSNYILPQLRLLGYDKDNINAASWGSGASQITINYDREVGGSFSSTSNGIITITKNGYYRIRLSAQTQSDGYNNRVSFMNYLKITASGTTTDYDEDESKNFFGWVYIRNNTDGGHGSTSFQDYIYLETNDTIRPQHRLETGSDRNFENTLPSANIDNYLNLEIERLYDTNPE